MSEVVDKRRFTTDGEVIPQEFREYHHYEKVQGFRPAFDQVLVKLMKQEQEGMIIRPEMMEEPSEIAEVIAVGQGVFAGNTIYPIPFKVGQFVKFPANIVGAKQRFPGEPSEDTYTIIRAQDVWGSYDAG